VETPRVSTDVGQVHFHTFADEDLVFGMDEAQLPAIDVAKNSFQWLEARQPVRDCYRAKIPGMPYFIAGSQVLHGGIIQVAMGI
jgi:hypothetical protein